MNEARMLAVPDAARVLLVEDDEQLRQGLTRALSGIYQVTAVPSAEAAASEVRRERFEAVLCDIGLAGMDGVELLRRVRAADLDLPFLLMTGAPSVESAAHAVELGAARYLSKPLDLKELRKVLASVISVHRLAKARRLVQEEVGQASHGASDRAGVEAVIESAIASLRVVWQPVVSWPRRRVVGYEALMRSCLPNPAALLDAAARAGRSRDLARVLRTAIARAGVVAPVCDLYVNVQPEDLLDDELYDVNAPLGVLASRVVLEVDERATLDSISDLRQRLARLRKLGFRIALDDMGAGHAGMSSFAALEPEVVKIDQSLVQDLHRSATRRTLLGSLLSACRELRCAVIAEGVELPAERDALSDLGCELFQGFLFARPAAAFPEPTW